MVPFVPHVLTPQHSGVGSGQLKSFPPALQSISQSDSGMGPDRWFPDACRKVRFFRPPSDSKEPVKFCESNQTFLSCVSLEKSISGPLRWLHRMRNTCRLVSRSNDFGMLPVMALCEKYMHLSLLSCPTSSGNVPERYDCVCVARVQVFKLSQPADGRRELANQWVARLMWVGEEASDVRPSGVALHAKPSIATWIAGCPRLPDTFARSTRAGCMRRCLRARVAVGVVINVRSWLVQPVLPTELRVQRPQNLELRRHQSAWW